MGVFGIIATLISAMIGSAIFSLSGETINISAGYSVFSWLIAGVIMLFYALIVSKLSARFPFSGGLYFFPSLSFDRRRRNGEFLGFVSAIGTIICNIIAISFSAILVPVFLSQSGLNGFLLAFFSILIGLVLNLFRLSARTKANVFFAIILVVLLLVYSISVFLSGAFDNQVFLHSFAVNNKLDGFYKTLSSIPIASLGYGAIVSVCFIAGDVKNKKNTLALGTAIAALIVIGLYVLSISATLGVVAIDEDKRALSVFFVAIQNAFSSSPLLKYILIIAILVALVSTITIMFNITGITLQVLGKEKYLPKAFDLQTQSSSPWFSLLFVGVFSTLFLFYNLAFRMINLGAIFSIVTTIINIASFIAVSRNERRENRAEIVLAALLIVILSVSSFTSFFLSKDKSLTLIFTLIVFALCLIIFFLHKKRVPFCHKSLFVLYGTVEHGNALGRTVGMPTANIYPNKSLSKALEKQQGVYVSNITLDEKKYHALTNIGTRPSVDECKTIVVESHILDGFEKDIYGKSIEVEILKFIRPVKKMKDLAAVSKQVEIDKESAKKFWAEKN